MIRFNSYNSIFVFSFLMFIFLGYLHPTAQSPITIIIDGDMSEWDAVASLVNDSADDVPGMNLIGAQVSNDTEFLFIRMTYSNAYDFPLLWGNVTVRNQAEDVFVLMAFVSTDGSQEDTWVFPGISLNTSQNSKTAAIDDYTQYLQHAKMAADNASIEFKVPLGAIDSGNSSNLIELDFVFWHFDAFQASLQLFQATEEDRAPDSGYVTYFSNPKDQVSITTTSDSSSESTDTTTSMTTSAIPTSSGSSSQSSVTTTSLTISTTPTTSTTLTSSEPISSPPLSLSGTDEGFLNFNIFMASPILFIVIVIIRKARRNH